MSAINRKQQREIEIAEKKVVDGVKEFNELWKKAEEAQDVKERDKLMSDMKRELKRLQRLREQFRAWADDPSIREQGPLFEMRRLVETQMERFKDLEKEAKIKPFAKAGLQQKEKLDPAVEAKLNCEAWLRNCIARLAEQIEQFEADAEALTSSATDKKPPARVEELNNFISRHDEQSTKLEQVLRLVENEQVTSAEVDETLKESMEHYLESSTDPDFVEDELMYQGFPLGEGLENVGRIQSHDTPVRNHQDDKTDPANADSVETTPKDTLRVKAAKPGSAKSTASLKLGKAGDAVKLSQKKGRGRVSTPTSAASMPLPQLDAQEAKAPVQLSSPTAPPGLPSQPSPHTPKPCDSDPTQHPMAMDPPTPAATASSPASLLSPNISPFAQQVAVEHSNQPEIPFTSTHKGMEASYAKFTPSSPAASLVSPTGPGVAPLTGFNSQASSWHLQHPELSATLKGVRSSTTAQLLHGLSQAPNSLLVKPEQAADAYLQSLSPTRHAMNKVHGLELGIEEVASQLHGFDASPRQAEELQKMSHWPPVSSPCASASPSSRQSAQVQPAHQQLLVGRKSFAQAASPKEGAAETACGPSSTPVTPGHMEALATTISNDPLLSPPTSPTKISGSDATVADQGHSILLAKLNEALSWELSNRSNCANGCAPLLPEPQHPWTSIKRATTPSLSKALARLVDLEDQRRSPEKMMQSWARDTAATVLDCLEEATIANGDISPPGLVDAAEGEALDTEEGGAPLRRANSLNLEQTCRVRGQADSETQLDCPASPCHLTGSFDSFDVALRRAASLAPLNSHRVRMTHVTSMPYPTKIDTRRPRLDLNQIQRQDKAALGIGAPRSKGRRLHKAPTSPALQDRGKIAGGAAWGPYHNGLGSQSVKTPPAFSIPSFIPPPPPPRRGASRELPKASSLDAGGNQLQPFLERDHQKPYYASDIRRPQERSLLSASKDTMPQEPDWQYRKVDEPLSVFQQPRHKYNPATIRPVEWPLPSMWTPQVIPKLESSSFFEETSEGKWPEAALFAFVFQPGTTQQMHAAELLKKQGWLFNSHFRKWFHRPTNTTQSSREVTNSYEKGEWIFWDPNLNEEDEGWCAHQTNKDFAFMLSDLCS